MKCPHEFFKPGSLKCARCGEPMTRQARHVRVGAPDTQSERWIADRVRPDGARAKHAHDPLWAIATREMRAGR